MRLGPKDREKEFSSCKKLVQNLEKPMTITPSPTLKTIASENLKKEVRGKYGNRNKILLPSNRIERLSPTEKLQRDPQPVPAPTVLPSPTAPNTDIDLEHKRRYRYSHSRGRYPQQKLQKRIKATIETNGKQEVILPPPPKGPVMTRPDAPQIDIVQEVKRLLIQQSPLEPPKFKFTISPTAAEYNFNLLQENDFNLDLLLNDKSRPSITDYGSEFKPTSQLEPLLKNHHRWATLKRLLENGSKWKLTDVEKEAQSKDREAALIRGNHKSANKHSKFLESAISKEILKGWELLLPLESVDKIPNLVISPMGVAEHIGIQNDGTFAPKRRVTHDLSFPGKSSDHSINSRVIDDDLEPCMFGHALLRIVHRIVHLRFMHPKKIIWIRKDDAKSAYRRVHLNAETAVQSAVQLEIEGVTYILLALRLPFGGSPCPSEFCLVSDIIADATNDLFACKHWDPNSVHSKYVSKIPKPQSLPKSIQFGPALPTSVPNMEKDNCSADVFIDDIITLGVDIGNNVTKIMAGPCTIIHAMAHTASNDTTILRQDFIADDKNDVEGGPEEVKIVLGWVIDSRRLIIQLPTHKYIAWSSQLSSFQDRKSASSKVLQSLLGRLEQIATIIPMFGHFLNNIRQTEIRATASDKPQIINRRTREDLILATKFLNLARKGVNLNLMTFRVPTHIYINDASEHGLGGFATHGRAWGWVIPPKLRGRAHINLLEFLAQVVSIWIDILEKRVKPLDCLLGMGDNTASMGWLRRTNFREKDECDLEWYAKQLVARKLANLVLDSETVLYRQWFRGADNEVADSLSRDSFFLTHDSHKTFLLQTIPHQVPANFSIQPVPSKICSFISSILLLLPVQQQRSLPQKPSDLARGNVGMISSLELESNQYISKIFQDSNKTYSSQHSPKPYERPPSLKEIQETWWKAQSMPPSHMWHRPSGQTTGLTQDWTSMARPVSSYRNRCEPTGTRMEHA